MLSTVALVWPRLFEFLCGRAPGRVGVDANDIGELRQRPRAVVVAFWQRVFRPSQVLGILVFGNRAWDNLFAHGRLS